MLKTQIKASQITNLTDARYFAAWGIDWIGFDLEEGSENFVPPSSLLGIKDWIEGPKIIGEFNLLAADDILATASQLGLDGVQLGPFFPAQELVKLKGLQIIQKIVIDREISHEEIESLFLERKPEVDLFLLDFTANGISWEQVKGGQSSISILQINGWTPTYPILLDINFAASDHQELLDLGILGFAVKGGAEEKVGFKSFEDLDELFEAIEAE